MDRLSVCSVRVSRFRIVECPPIEQCTGITLVRLGAQMPQLAAERRFSMPGGLTVDGGDVRIEEQPVDIILDDVERLLDGTRGRLQVDHVHKLVLMTDDDMNIDLGLMSEGIAANDLEVERTEGIVRSRSVEETALGVEGQPVRQRTAIRQGRGELELGFGPVFGHERAHGHGYVGCLVDGDEAIRDRAAYPGLMCGCDATVEGGVECVVHR